MELKFANATGALKMTQFANSTKPANQVPLHDANYSQTLKEKMHSMRLFDKTKTEINLYEEAHTMSPSGRPKAIPKETTQTIEPTLNTADRSEAIYNRINKPKEIKVPEWEAKCQPKIVKPSNANMIQKDIPVANGTIRSVTVVPVPIIPAQSPKMPRDTYFHGGDVFDDYQGTRK
ncbi:Conserved_hypothetical protein [Hexamita inflata]|uniref:Uncharacterized protein n=1 Tax=Hexamita inflata TaxID=28002 RepID=A0AA86U5P0_9EUKA|nr:Conserved hypothetical protein [Hexamita inflata]CAI9938847.1 Conserved hypothetical protein [Hexamita inflata]CAI9948602.1 Conserved hypothetical protein [Hexamita inflata]CAI9949236.1 Conserved hypothetical protein [Hexamita inflata]